MKQGIQLSLYLRGENSGFFNAINAIRGEWLKEGVGEGGGSKYVDCRIIIITYIYHFYYAVSKYYFLGFITINEETLELKRSLENLDLKFFTFFGF